jgi:hypothetical protein
MPTTPDRPQRLPRIPALALGRDDLRGLVRLAAEGVGGVAGIVESMQLTIAQRAVLRWLPLPPAAGRLGVPVTRAVRLGAQLAGRGLDAALARLPANSDAEPSPAREAFVAALNGVMGDHLAATGNPLAIPMALRRDGRPLAGPPPDAGGRVAVLVHGLGMNDLQWCREGHDHGQVLAALGWTVLRLHYNTGLHVSANGRAFERLLGALVAGWPVPVRELAIVGHSMGGLVARSALHAGAGRPWRQLPTTLVCLGTPHHGAPLERGGRWADQLLAWSPYAAPLARIGRLRSAGITDLRHGNVQDADWMPHPHGGPGHDARVPTPLPRDLRCHLVAAVLSADAGSRRAAAVGDGLVPLASAWGRHPERRLALRLPPGHRHLLPRANHWDLLDHPQVAAWLRDWLA